MNSGPSTPAQSDLESWQSDLADLQKFPKEDRLAIPACGRSPEFAADLVRATYPHRTPGDQAVLHLFHEGGWLLNPKIANALRVQFGAALMAIILEKDDADVFLRKAWKAIPDASIDELFHPIVSDEFRAQSMRTFHGIHGHPRRDSDALSKMLLTVKRATLGLDDK